MSELHIADEFSRYLGGRYKADGPGSGQEFRDKKLLPRLTEALLTKERLVVVLDGVAGVPSSFLEEAFGGILRARRDLSLKDVEEVLEITAHDPELLPFVNLAYEYLRREDARRRPA